jgi:hypothetical protein
MSEHAIRCQIEAIRQFVNADCHELSIADCIELHSAAYDMCIALELAIARARSREYGRGAA